MKLFIYIIYLGTYIAQANDAYTAEMPEREESQSLKGVPELAEPENPRIVQKVKPELQFSCFNKGVGERGELSTYPPTAVKEESPSFHPELLHRKKKRIKLPSFLQKTAEIKEVKLPRRRNCESLKKNKEYVSQELTEVIVKTVQNPLYDPSVQQEDLEEWEKKSNFRG
jgi:hypothetical protein